MGQYSRYRNGAYVGGRGSLGRLCFVFETGPHIAQVGLIAKDNLELLILPAVPLECWEKRHMHHAGFI